MVARSSAAASPRSSAPMLSASVSSLSSAPTQGVCSEVAL